MLRAHRVNDSNEVTHHHKRRKNEFNESFKLCRYAIVVNCFMIKSYDMENGIDLYKADTMAIPYNCFIPIIPIVYLMNKL